MTYMASPTNAVTDPTLVRFARRLSHDLNNYSTVVRTYAELLLADCPPDSPARADLEEIQRAAEGMVAYLQRVTRFARAGMMRRSAIAVDECLADAVAQFQRSAPDRVVETNTATGALIDADPVWFRDVLLEVLQNAHEAAPVDTAVRVVATANDRTVTITVHDGGNGLAETLPELFEPFVTTKHGVRGAGQGLALTMAFALACHGDLGLARDGHDTVVTLTLPRRAAEGSAG